MGFVWFVAKSSDTVSSTETGSAGCSVGVGHSIRSSIVGDMKTHGWNIFVFIYLYKFIYTYIYVYACKVLEK